MGQALSLSWYLHRLCAMKPAEMLGHARRRLYIAADRKGFRTAPFDPAARTLSAPTASPRDAQAAEMARKGMWRILHGIDLHVGPQPRWQRDYLAGVDVSTADCGLDVNPRSLPGGADIKVIADLNRWYHVAVVARAVASGLRERGDAEWCRALLEDWVSANRPFSGWNWSSALESAVRLIHYATIEPALRNADIPTDELTRAIVPPHVHFTWRYRSFGSSANNHWMGELAGLIVALAAWPDAARFAPALAALAADLEAEILKQFAPDGFNREQALHYHHFSLDLCRTAAVALQAIGRELGSAARARLAKAEEAARLLDPPVCGWDFGDSDDADLLGLADAPAGHAPEGWNHLACSGYASWRDPRWFLRCDASPLGFLSTAAHGHCDALHVSLWFEGKPVLIDPGTGAYYGDSALRNGFAAWSAHNGPVPEDRDTPARRGTFLWANHHAVPALAAGQDGVEMSIKCGAERTRRRVERMADGAGWRLIDAIAGHGQRFHVRWTFPPGAHVEELSSGVFRIANGCGMLTMRASSNWVSARVAETRCSPSLRVVEKTHCLELVGRADAREHLTTIERS